MAATVEAPADMAVRNLECYSVAQATDWLRDHKLTRRKRVMMTGSREWAELRVIRDALRSYLSEGQVLVEGEARGADQIARMEASHLGVHVLGFPAPWGQLGRAAGMRRNEVMLAMRPSIVLAFHDELKASRGTRGACRIAWDLGLPIHLFDSSGASQTFQRSAPKSSFEDLRVDYRP
jgi:hypothetical protein